MGNQASIQITKDQLDVYRQNMKLGPESVSQSKNAMLIRKNVMDAFNYRTMDNLRRFAAPNSAFFFKGAERGMPLEAFIESMSTMHASFPDVAVTYDSIEEVRPGEVLVKNVTSHGTHTGAPFGFGPFPPIPKTGKECTSQFNVLFTLEKGKLTEALVEPRAGQLMGPANYYLQIGGKIDVTR
eukprot:Nitzschia sp. Nitz4//scaffold134_size62860//38414//38962//NITZ4_006331-RA/size62860-processed-gene-0.35-mRNA-1//1//CDS//3329535505//673//frame0